MLTQHLKMLPNFRDSYTQVKLFGILMSANFPIFHLLNHISSSDAYQNLPLRLSLSVLCLPLIFVNQLQNYFSRQQIGFYWFCAVTLCLPFFFSYMTLMNNCDSLWLMNLISAFFFTLLIMDTRPALVCTIFGFFIGYSLFTITNDLDNFNLNNSTIIRIFITFLSALIIGSLFSSNRENAEKEKQEALRAMGGTIAHEMRTPLATLGLSAYTLMNRIDKFLKKSEQKKAECEDPQLEPGHLSSRDLKGQKIPSTFDEAPTYNISAKDLHDLRDLGKFIQKSVQEGQTVITMTLETLSGVPERLKLQNHNLTSLLGEILANYPFEEDERALLTLEITPGLTVYADQQLFQNVLYNLLKNSLYFIKAAQKGRIYIRAFQENTKHNGPLTTIVFEDTGPGIEERHLSKLFQPFNSRRRHGTGLGLYFCRNAIEAMGGKINASSRFDHYTRFTLTLPCPIDIKAQPLQNLKKAG